MKKIKEFILLLKLRFENRRLRAILYSKGFSDERIDEELKKLEGRP